MLSTGLVSSPQLRNMGTLGGNVCVDTRCNYYNQSYEWRKAVGFCMKKDGDICLVAPGSPRCWAVSSSDTAPVAWSLGAKVKLVGGMQHCGESERPREGLRPHQVWFLEFQPRQIADFDQGVAGAPGVLGAQRALPAVQVLVCVGMCFHGVPSVD